MIMVKLYYVQCFDSDQTFRGYRNTDPEVVAAGGHVTSETLRIWLCWAWALVIWSCKNSICQSFRSHTVAADHIKSYHGMCAFVIVTRPFMAAVAQLQKSQPPPAVNGTSRFMGGPFKTVLLLCWAWALVMWSRKNITGRSSGRHPVAADAAILLVEYDMKKSQWIFYGKAWKLYISEHRGIVQLSGLYQKANSVGKLCEPTKRMGSSRRFQSYNTNTWCVSNHG